MSEKEKKTMILKELEEQLIKKALMNNPKETLKNQFGIQVPEDVEVKVVEESTKVVYQVLPVDPDELTDEQMDGISGGFPSHLA